MAILKTRIRHTDSAATNEDIIAIIGQMDHIIVDALLHTGATPDEIIQASEWLEENHRTKAIYARHMGDRVRRVYEILDYARSGLNGNSYQAQ